MIDRLKFLLNRLREKLWIKPLMMCAVSIGVVLLAKAVDHLEFAPHLPRISSDSIEALLTILSTSMLVIATFAVGSMVSSYASASGTATPRSFPVVIADDVSQYALSTFIGAFIFSVVGLVILKDGYFEHGGRFALFVATGIVFAIVILTFVRWVDRIARLGRLGETIDKVEHVTAAALRQRRRAPTLGCRAVEPSGEGARPVRGTAIGYVQRIDVACLQQYAVEAGLRVTVRALPGTFIAPDRLLAEVTPDAPDHGELDITRIEEAFKIGDDRTFDEDPRFGFVVLSEIAGRALSPAVNDPGTAIDIIGTLVRLFAQWAAPIDEQDLTPLDRDRVAVPELAVEDMFDDAFTSIARDGAGSIEVATRLQKALAALESVGHPGIRRAAMKHSRQALARAEGALTLPADLQSVRTAASFSEAFGD